MSAVLRLLRKLLTMLRSINPDIELVVIAKAAEQTQTIQADASLLPAIVNLINNAIRATRANNSNKIELTHGVQDGVWQLAIHDFGRGFTLSKLAELGVKPVDSEQGLGMAVFLSYASLERLGGKLTLTNHHQGGALVTVSLPSQQ